MHIIVDGYNLIRQSPALRQFEKFSLEEGRNELIRRLAHYKRLKHHRISVVFDGWIEGSPMEERSRSEGIAVIFSRRGEKADDVIKDMVMHGNEEMLVVTSDRGIIGTVTRKGTVAISSPEFEARMQQEEEKAFLLTKGVALDEEHDDGDRREPGDTRKKGPSRRLPKKKKRELRSVKKL